MSDMRPNPTDNNPENSHNRTTIYNIQLPPANTASNSIIRIVHSNDSTDLANFENNDVEFSVAIRSPILQRTRSLHGAQNPIITSPGTRNDRYGVQVMPSVRVICSGREINMSPSLCECSSVHHAMPRGFPHHLQVPQDRQRSFSELRRQWSEYMRRNMAAPRTLAAEHVKRGSQDHMFPCYPTSGEVRAMFGTNAITDRPEYGSPATMHDPPDWRPQLPDIVQQLQASCWASHIQCQCQSCLQNQAFFRTVDDPRRMQFGQPSWYREPTHRDVHQFSESQRNAIATQEVGIQHSSDQLDVEQPKVTSREGSEQKASQNTSLLFPQRSQIPSVVRLNISSSDDKEEPGNTQHNEPSPIQPFEPIGISHNLEIHTQIQNHESSGHGQNLENSNRAQELKPTNSEVRSRETYSRKPMDIQNNLSNHVSVPSRISSQTESHKSSRTLERSRSKIPSSIDQSNISLAESTNEIRTQASKTYTEVNGDPNSLQKNESSNLRFQEDSSAMLGKSSRRLEFGPASEFSRKRFLEEHDDAFKTNSPSEIHSKGSFRDPNQTSEVGKAIEIPTQDNKSLYQNPNQSSKSKFDICALDKGQQSQSNECNKEFMEGAEQISNNVISPFQDSVHEPSEYSVEKFSREFSNTSQPHTEREILHNRSGAISYKTLSSHDSRPTPELFPSPEELLNSDSPQSERSGSLPHVDEISEEDRKHITLANESLSKMSDPFVRIAFERTLEDAGIDITKQKDSEECSKEKIILINNSRDGGEPPDIDQLDEIPTTDDAKDLHNSLFSFV